MSFRYTPEVCVWELTLTCNMRCIHCGSSAGIARPRELNVEECLVVADELLELECRQVTFIGGEVFLYPGWERVARRLSDGGASVNIITNGFLMGDREIAQIRHAGLANVGISIDGLERNHNRIRNNPQSFDRALEAVRRLRAEGFEVGVVTSLLDFNVPDLPGMYDLFLDEGIALWQLQIATCMGNLADALQDGAAANPEAQTSGLGMRAGKGMDKGVGKGIDLGMDMVRGDGIEIGKEIRIGEGMVEETGMGERSAGWGQESGRYGEELDTGFERSGMLLKPSRVPEITRFIAEKCQEGRIQVYAGDDIGYFNEHEPYLRNSPRGHSSWQGCQAGLRVVGIGSTGDVKGCESLYSDEFVEGNLRSQTLREIWEREGNFAYNREFSTDLLEGGCAGCDQGAVCRGGCRGACHFTAGSLFENHYCCYPGKMIDHPRMETWSWTGTRNP